MSQIKLDPLVDLGISQNDVNGSVSSTTSNSSNNSMMPNNDLNSSSMMMDSTPSYEVKDVPMSSSVDSMSEFDRLKAQTTSPVSPSIPESPLGTTPSSSFSAPSPMSSPTPVATQSTSFQGISDINNFAAPSSPKPMTVNEPVIQKSEGEAGKDNKISNILLIFAIVLFVVSLAALVFFALSYFKVI